MTSEEDEEESELEEICRITGINKTLPDNNDHYGIELKINETKQKFTIDTGSQQQDFIGQRNRPLKNNPYKIQKTIRDQPHSKQYLSENTNKIWMLTNTTESTVISLPPTRLCEKRNRPTT